MMDASTALPPAGHGMGLPARALDAEAPSPFERLVRAVVQPLFESAVAELAAEGHLGMLETCDGPDRPCVRLSVRCAGRDEEAPPTITLEPSMRAGLVELDLGTAREAVHPHEVAERIEAFIGSLLTRPGLH